MPSRLQDRVGLWVTINEPNVYAYSAYSSGVFPPGERDLQMAIRVMANMTRAHAAAYRAIHTIQSEALVGIAHHFRGMRPARAYNPLDRMVAGLRSRAFNDAIPRALRDGDFRLLWHRERIPEAKGSQDFVGLNYYTEERVAFSPSHSVGVVRSRAASPHRPISVRPASSPTSRKGFWRALTWAHAFRLPIYVTENGAEDPYGGFRPRYLAGHVRQLWRATNLAGRSAAISTGAWLTTSSGNGVGPSDGGCGHWTPRRQARTKRPSADFYAEICRENGLSTDMVARYAPEALSKLFPVDDPGQLAAGASF